MNISSKKIVFSFCIYGNSKKYCQGLLENLKLIRIHFPSFHTYIYYYSNVPQHYIEQYKTYPNVHLKKPEKFDHPNMVDRFFVLDDDPTVDIVLIRDADSRIHDRDRFCINHFLNSSQLCHTIRDHHFHHSPIMGGLWGIKRGVFPKDFDMKNIYRHYKRNVQNQSPDNLYGHDMFFLRYCIYQYVLHSLIVYTFADYLRLHSNELLIMLPSTITNNEFCGQVIDYDQDGNELSQFTFPK